MIVSLFMAHGIVIPTARGNENDIAVEITGKNINLIKTLCGEEAPEVNLNALLATEIKDADGNTIEEYEGKILHYLPHTATELMTGAVHLDKIVFLKGVLYKNAQVVAVEEYAVQDTTDQSEDWEDWDDWDELGITSPSQKQII